MALFPKRDWDPLSHVLIFHGRRVCDAKAPACDRCGVANVCPSMGHAEKIGRKPPRKRKKAVVAAQPATHSEAAERAAKVVQRAPKKTARAVGATASAVVKPTVKKRAPKSAR
jgi:endonuclease-3